MHTKMFSVFARIIVNDSKLIRNITKEKKKIIIKCRESLDSMNTTDKPYKSNAEAFKKLQL